ncbi:MAG: hypothetical protein GPJ50_14550 [Candidatus Heimdallarchaeota archaeon]|nr:hypothetical protein [Candidatus Heimdallarchaeota archaeon]
MNNKIAYLEPADILLSINVTDLKKAEKFLTHLWLGGNSNLFVILFLLL